jgi:transcriptional regulator with XRE-family HTH domain
MNEYDAAPEAADIFTIQWTEVAKRIQQARIRTGLSETTLAQRLGITVDSYEDLEHDDSEAYTVATLRQLETLGRVVGVEPSVLLLGMDVAGSTSTVTFAEITAKLAERMTETGMTAKQLGDEIGWHIEKVLADPESRWE